MVRLEGEERRKRTKKLVQCTSEMEGSGTAKNAVKSRVFIYSVPIVPVNIYIGVYKNKKMKYVFLFFFKTYTSTGKMVVQWYINFLTMFSYSVSLAE